MVVVLVVVEVRELLFLMTSVICMRIRGRGQRLPQLLTTFVQIFALNGVLTTMDSQWYFYVICHVSIKPIGILYSLAP